MHAVGKTDKGMVREMNQDYIFVSSEPVGPLPNLFLVADGMGGHNAGDFASRFSVQHLIEYMKDQPAQTAVIPALREGIQAVNQLLYVEASHDLKLSGTGTTLVAAVYGGGMLYVANVGDSRLYLVGKEIRQVTRDHSYVEEMVAMGRMNRGSADYRRNKNIITRAVGTMPRVNIDIFETAMAGDEVFLLCSDGLSNMVEDATIHKIIKNAPSLDAAARILVDRANDNGGDDNISVVLVRPEGSGVRVC